MEYGRFAPNNRPKEGEYYYHIFIGCLFFLNTPRPFHEGIDVDCECIERLEEEMFEVSERAGIREGGNCRESSVGIGHR